MNRVQHAVAAQLPVPLTARPVIEVPVYSPGPMWRRCGRCLSEDFDGRLFWRGYEGPDPADITPRLPLCHRVP